MSAKNWEIKGLSLPLDLEDLATMERYEAAFLRMKKEEQRIAELPAATERIKAYCAMYHRTFADIFDEKSADIIFQDMPLHSGNYEAVFFDFLDFVQNQKFSIRQKRAAKIRKYAPKPNRKNRRKHRK